MRLLTTSLLIVLALGLSAQHNALNGFSASVLPEGVFLQWTLTAGNTCKGIDIERADSDGEYELVGHIEGVCGSEVENEDFDFIDSSPVIGQEVSYRLVLGLLGRTEVVSIIYFEPDAQGFSLTYAAPSNQLILRSTKPHSQPYSVSIYNLRGESVAELNMSGNELIMDISHLNVGVYLVATFDESQLLFNDRFVKFD